MSSENIPTFHRGGGRNWGRVWRMILKESREILRDRRTILTLVLMPLLVYPLISIGFQKFLLTEGEKAKRPKIGLGFRSEDEARFVMRLIALGEGQVSPNRGSVDNPAQPSLPPQEFEALVGEDIEKEVQLGKVDLGIFVESKDFKDISENEDVAVDLKLIAVKGAEYATTAVSAVEKRLTFANARLLQERLRVLNVKQRPEPVATKFLLVKPEGGMSSGAVSLTSLIPVVLILMTITGGVYPAIDLTAGERERGTMEMLISSPVPRMDLLFSKFVAVVLIAVMTAMVNMASMVVTLMASGLGKILWGDTGFSVMTLVEVMGLLVLNACFFSAVLLSLTSFARSFKEAQAYLIPLMMISLAPGMMSLMPGIKLEGWLLIVPLMNISLLGRDLLQGVVDPGAAIVVVSFTVLSAFAAISLAARLFGGEAVLYGSSVGWGEFLQRPKRERTAATMSAALLTLAMLFPLQFVSVNLLAQIGAISLGARLLVMGICSMCLFMGTAALANWWGNVRFSSGFQWSRPHLLTIPAGMLLGVSLWPFALEMTLWLRSWGMVALKSEKFQAIQELLEQAQAVPLPVVLISFALIPALSEEFFFRGFLQTALMKRFEPAKSILLSALLFGSFHLITTDGLAIERFPPSTLLGVVLGWICWRTKSIFPGMMLHMMHNGLLTSLAYHSEDLKRLGWGVSTEEHVPFTWLATAGTIAAVGFGLMLLATKKQGESLNEPQLDGADR